MNMVFNAIDAMPEGGTLTLSTSTVDQSVVIKVIDTGVGMYPEVRSRIFDPFFTTKGKAGLGLGLAVSFGIIRRHGATLKSSRNTGMGPSFSSRSCQYVERSQISRPMTASHPGGQHFTVLSEHDPAACLLLTTKTSSATC